MNLFILFNLFSMLLLSPKKHQISMFLVPVLHAGTKFICLKEALRY